jgi:hypothetical protein
LKIRSPPFGGLFVGTGKMFVVLYGAIASKLAPTFARIPSAGTCLPVGASLLAMTPADTAQTTNQCCVR